MSEIDFDQLEEIMSEENELTVLIAFMQGPDNAILGRLIHFFSEGGKYLHPRELKPFWESLTEGEKNYYRMLVKTRYI